jgi:hypothetical protein
MSRKNVSCLAHFLHISSLRSIQIVVISAFQSIPLGPQNCALKCSPDCELLPGIKE